MTLPNIDRNEEIYQRKLAGWSFRKLAYHYNLDVKTVYRAYKRIRDRNAVEK